MSDMAWLQGISFRERKISDEVGHFDLTHDFFKHIWSN